MAIRASTIGCKYLIVDGVDGLEWRALGDWKAFGRQIPPNFAWKSGASRSHASPSCRSAESGGAPPPR